MPSDRPFDVFPCHRGKGNAPASPVLKGGLKVGFQARAVQRGHHVPLKFEEGRDWAVEVFAITPRTRCSWRGGFFGFRRSTVERSNARLHPGCERRDSTRGLLAASPYRDPARSRSRAHARLPHSGSRSRKLSLSRAGEGWGEGGRSSHPQPKIRVNFCGQKRDPFNSIPWSLASTRAMAGLLPAGPCVGLRIERSTKSTQLIPEYGKRRS